MSESPYPEFVDACCAGFRRLVDVYGFAEPEIDPIGRETYVRYRKGHREISIAYELGAAPIVEFFYPSSETGERPTPWAELDGVQRTRRFPRLAISVRFKKPDAATFCTYLAACAEALEREERAFLSEPIHDQPR